MKNKRGQVFLIAAIIIIGMIIGFATAVNSVRVGSEEDAFYELAEEIGFETKEVLDYGVFNREEGIDGLVSGFLEKYANYISQEQVVFVYGDADGNLEALFFEEAPSGSVGINTGSITGTTLEITDIKERKAQVVNEDGIVKVTVNNITYDFTLREGFNFYFVLVKEKGEKDVERFVATG